MSDLNDKPCHAAVSGAVPTPAEGLRLVRAFGAIRNAGLRRNVIQLVELLSATNRKR